MALDVSSIRVGGRWYRHVPAGADPTVRPVPPGDSRWQHGSVVDALYLADSEDCAWAEWYRHLAESAIPPTVAMPRDLWTYDISPIELADLSDSARLARVGLTRPTPGRRTWAAFQVVGEQLHHDGWRGLVAPSAARSASRVLVMFLPGATIRAEVTATSRTRVTNPPPPPTGMRT